MAHSNWAWIEAVNPPDIHAGYRAKRGNAKYADRRLGSFWDSQESGRFRPCTDREGKLLNHVGGKGKTVDVVPHTQPVKGIVIDPKTGQMKEVITG